MTKTQTLAAEAERLIAEYKMNMQAAWRDLAAMKAALK